MRGCCDVTVEAAMKQVYPTARPEERLGDALCRMDEDGVLVVVDDAGRLLGVVGQDAAARALCEGLGGARVEDVMNRSPLVLRPGMRLDKVLPLMLLAGAKAAPVVDQEGVVVGLVTLPLIARALHEEVDVEELPSAG
ncbi:MAG: CBS domain-containing protein [Desulfurococcales archaeon]|nr:CBS domain-containing protein [Desulfurococcales archaeon]